MRRKVVKNSSALYVAQSGTLALASLPFLGRGSVLVDIGWPAGDRPPYYAAEYVYASFARAVHVVFYALSADEAHSPFAAPIYR